MKCVNRIGLFVYDRFMESFIKELAIKLVEAGYAVDLFYRGMGTGSNFTDIGEFEGYKDIRFFDFPTDAPIRQVLTRNFQRVLNILARRFSIKLKSKPESIIASQILQTSKQIICGSQYLCFIGVEKMGLIWAGILSQQCQCPLIYYSLELYIEGHPLINYFQHLREAEKKYHQLSSATIIQDGPRAEALLKANEITSTNILYFPVSVKGDPVREKSDYLHNMLNIDKRKKIILYFGALYDSRFMTQIVESAKGLGDDMVLVLHGFGFGLRASNYIKYLQAIADKEKVYFSFNLVPENEVVKIISSAHIGLALYDTTYPNDSLIAFSSAKMAHYSQCGIPVIAFETDSFTQLMNQYRCGELIHFVDEIPQKTCQIMENYGEYQRQAHTAFEKFYNFDKNFAEFLRNFKDMAF